MIAGFKDPIQKIQNPEVGSRNEKTISGGYLGDPGQKANPFSIPDTGF